MTKAEVLIARGYPPGVGTLNTDSDSWKFWQTKWNTVLDRSADIPRVLRKAFEAMTSGRPAIIAHRCEKYGLRPEALRFVPAGSGLAGVLTMTEPTGPESYAFVDTAAGPLVVRVPGKVPAAVGDTVALAWQPTDVHLFDAASEQRIVPQPLHLAVA